MIVWHPTNLQMYRSMKNDESVQSGRLSTKLVLFHRIGNLDSRRVQTIDVFFCVLIPEFSGVRNHHKLRCTRSSLTDFTDVAD